MASAVAGWSADTPFTKIVVPDPATAGATVNSSPFRVPKGTLAMTFHVPSTAHTFSLSALTPALDDQTTDAWKLVSTVAGATPTAIAGVAANGIAVTLSAAAVGGGILRLVSSADESGAPLTIWVVFHLAM